MKKYYMKVEEYARNESGKSWKSKTYTYEGYIPTKLTSINPDKTKKVIRYFTPVR